MDPCMHGRLALCSHSANARHLHSAPLRVMLLQEAVALEIASLGATFGVEITGEAGAEGSLGSGGPEAGVSASLEVRVATPPLPRHTRRIPRSRGLAWKIA